jgi:sugar lactone lactonase YvrE
LNVGIDQTPKTCHAARVDGFFTSQGRCAPLRDIGATWLVGGLVLLFSAPACTNTSNDPAPDEQISRSTPMDAGAAEVAPIGKGYLWFAGSELNAFTQDQTRASSDKGPAITIQPATFTGTYHDLAFDPQGNLWTVPITGDQVMRVPQVGLMFERPSPDITVTSTALKSPQTIAFDNAGNLWVNNFSGSGAGVSSIVRFDGLAGMPQGNYMLNPGVTIVPGTDPAMVKNFSEGLSMAFDKNGSLWFGSSSSLMRFDSPGSLQGMVTAAPNAVLTTGDYFTTMAFDSAGSLWVTATNVGYIVLRIDQPGTLQGAVTATPAARVSLMSGDANFAGGMAFDSTGSLWIAMSNRIIELTNPSSMMGNVSPGPQITLALPSTSYPDLGSKLAFWPKPDGLPLY